LTTAVSGAASLGEMMSASMRCCNSVSTSATCLELSRCALTITSLKSGCLAAAFVIWLLKATRHGSSKASCEKPIV